MRLNKFFRMQNPVYILILVNILFFVLLFFYVDPLDTFILVSGAGVIALILVSYIAIIKLQMGDEYIFLIISMLTSLGIIMLYRISSTYGVRQISLYALGIILYFLSYTIFSYIKRWDKLLYFYLAFNFISFIATIAVGVSVGGATNWIQIGGFSFQPAEIIKISFVFFIAAYYKLRLSLDKETIPIKESGSPNKETSNSFDKEVLDLDSEEILTCQGQIKPSPQESTGQSFEYDQGFIEKLNEKVKNVYVFLGLVYMHIFFLLMQRELGISALFFIVFLSIFYIYEEDYKLLLYNIGFISIIGVISYFTMSHVNVRLSTWINPWADISNTGYQITQSLFAIAEGGFFGTGLGLGNPRYIPEVHTDFIFSAICEEIGVFGGISVVLLYFILTYRGFKIALTIKDVFKRIVALGITLIYGYQTFIIIGGVIKLIPLTGVTLPFISYGGTSLISAFISFGVLQAISKKTMEEEGGVIVD